MSLANDLLECVVRPVLQGLEMHSGAAERLIIGTALAESGLRALRQYRGPALGFWQMEPETYHDIWDNFLYQGRHQLVVRVTRVAQTTAMPEDMVWNLRYACAMARVHYWRVPEPIPESVAQQARYWKEYYNTLRGAGTPRHYVDAWDAANADGLEWAEP